MAAEELCGGGGFLGLVIAGLPFIAMVSLGTLFYAWRRGRSLASAPILLSFGVLAAGELAALFFNERTRRTWVAAETGLDPENAWSFHGFMPYWGRTWASQFVACSVAVIVIPLFALAVAIRRTDRSELQAWRMHWVGMVSIGSMVWATALCLSSLPAFVDGWGFDARARYDQFVESFGLAHVERGKTAVLTMAVLATLCVLLLTSGPLRHAPPLRTLYGGVSLAIAGGLVWALTRGLAYDARHPLPFSEGGFPRDSMGIPPGERCAPPTDAPTFVWGSNGVYFDEFRLSAGDATRALETKRELFNQTRPGRPFPDVIAFAVPQQTPTTLVVPFATAVRDAGISGIEVLLARRRPSVTTRTLGTIDRPSELCAVTIRADEAMTERTWGELAAHLQRLPD
jgi:hypothetical protein